MRRNQIIPTEHLLDNIIDKELQDVLLPLNIVQLFFLMSKYTVINNFISPNNNVAHLKSAIGASLLILSTLLRFFYHLEPVERFGNYTIYFLLYFDLILYIVLCIFTHIISGMQSCNMVHLIIKLQRVLNMIIIDKKSFLFKLKFENWISVVSMVFVFVLFFISGVEDLDFTSLLANVVLTFSTLIYDLHIIDVTRTIVFIKSELNAWNQNMQAYVKDDKNEEPLQKDAIFDAYANIVKAFNLCNKVYQFSIANFGLQTFIYVLINLQIMLELVHVSNDNVQFQITKARVFIAAWNVKSFVLMTLLSVSSEGFYRGVRVAESTCAQIIADDQFTTEMRKACKNVLRLNRAAFHKLSAYGMFEMDAAFPLRVLDGVVPYTVVLLQFAFL